MADMVLGIGYHQNESKDMRIVWKQHNVDFHFANSIEEATQRLLQNKYICITICAGRIYNIQLDELHSIQQIPIVVLSPNHEISKRAENFQRGVVEYLLNDDQRQEARSSGKDAVQYYLDNPNKNSKPLTIITSADLFFCLEHRIVEVRGQRIVLTPKEFDILALLITHPKQVFPYGTIIDSVWNEDEAHYSRKALANHMSSLRNKLKTHPDIPNYVVSVHGIGYKFESD